MWYSWRYRLLDALVPDWHWIGRLWRHHRLARRQWDAFLWAERRGWGKLVRCPQIVYTQRADCLGATLAILLRRRNAELRYECGPDDELAWEDLGTYRTDYGTGHAWAALVYVNGQYCTYEDGSL